MEDKKEINIELSPEVAKGSYSNFSIVTHSPNEFIVDFVEMLPGLPKAQVVSRIIMTPENMKRLNRAINDNIKKFEEIFGEIKLHGEGPIIPMGPNNNTKS